MVSVKIKFRIKWKEAIWGDTRKPHFTYDSLEFESSILN